MNASFLDPGSRGRFGSRRDGSTLTGSFIVDGGGTVLGFDEGMEELTGWPATEVVGRDRHSGTRMLLEGDLAAVEKGPRTRELRLQCRDGSRVSVEAAVERLDAPGTRVLVRVRRIVARSAACPPDAGVEGLDGLTGLLDRAGFLSRLTVALAAATRNSRPLALIVGDVDHLREINDRKGRERGDDVLRKLAGILRVTVGAEENLARIDADDFAVLLPDGSRGEARQVAAGLRSTVERFRFFAGGDGDDGKVTLSLGAASYPADADTAHDLLDRAYEALDEARSFGRNRVWCYLRRPRVPLEVPVFFDAAESLLVGYSRDLSPSGIFVQTSAPIDIGMRCALTFPLPGQRSKVHVIGRVVRAVPPEIGEERVRIPGMGVEFERFNGPSDRRAIEAFLHLNESLTLRPEDGTFSV